MNGDVEVVNLSDSDADIAVTTDVARGETQIDIRLPKGFGHRKGRAFNPTSKRQGASVRTRTQVEGAGGGATISLASEEEEYRSMMSPLLLTFHDQELEDNYYAFAYITSGFYGGKLWHVVAIALSLLAFLYHHTIVHGWDDGRVFGKEYWAAMTGTTILAVVVFVALFVPRLAPYREPLFLLSLFAHWPAFLISYYFGLGPQYAYAYPMTVGCLFFCAIVVQARFFRVFWFVFLVPVTVLIVSTSTFPARYWDSHRPHEAIYWCLYGLPVVLLRVFEMNSRRLFLAMIKCEERVLEIESKINSTQGLIAHFFPKTPTLDLLTNDAESADRSKVYFGAVIVVSDMVGFTAWTGETEPVAFIASLTRIFANIDAILPDYGIEKIANIGDSFVGVSFPHPEREDMTTEQRCALALDFCVRILPFGGNLKMRVGAHVGQLTGAFVGSVPPKFDIFGDDVDVANAMEREGLPGMVHATNKLVQAAKSGGSPVGDVSSSVAGGGGLLFARWERNVECSSLPIQNSSSQGAAHTDSDDEDEAEKGQFLVHGTDFSHREVFKVSLSLLHLSKHRHVKGVLPMVQAMISASSTSTGQLDHSGTGRMMRSSRSLENVSSTDRSGETNNVSSSTRARPSQNKRYSDGVALDAMSQGSSNSESFNLSYVSPTASINSAQASTSSVSAVVTAAADDFRFHPVLLYFLKDKHEDSFREYLNHMSIHVGTVLVIVAMQLIIVVGFLANASFHTTKNVAMSVVMAALSFACAAVMFARRRTLKNPVPLLTATYTVVCLMGVFLDVEDTREKKNDLTRGVSMLLVNVYLGTQIFLINRFTIRLGLVVFAAALGECLEVLRNEVVGDGVMPYDLIFVFGIIGFCFMSYFADFTLRSAFVADRMLLSALTMSKSRHHRTTKGALRVMLPKFAYRRLLDDATQRHRNELVAAGMLLSPMGVSGGSVTTPRLNVSPQHRTSANPFDGFLSPRSAVSAPSSVVEEDALLAASLFRVKPLSATERSDEVCLDEMAMSATTTMTERKVWQFDSACVMFLLVDTGPTTVSPSQKATEASTMEDIGENEDACFESSAQFIRTINECFVAIEQILKASNIHKIKTIGTAVMCVCGINEDEPDPVNTMVRAALLLRRSVFEARGDWTYQFGLHLGPCTGAVMGKESLMFDIFGDSVNMASRMASNAPPKGIQLSPSAAFALSSDVFTTEQRPPIQVKGKGTIEPVLVIDREEETLTLSLPLSVSGAPR